MEELPSLNIVLNNTVYKQTLQSLLHYIVDSYLFKNVKYTQDRIYMFKSITSEFNYQFISCLILQQVKTNFPNFERVPNILKGWYSCFQCTSIEIGQENVPEYIVYIDCLLYVSMTISAINFIFFTQFLYVLFFL